MFDVASCMASAGSGRLDAWVHSYLGGGPWANAGLRDGLRRQPRYWTGPHLLPLSRLERCCGPEPAMEYRVPAETWRRKVAGIASHLDDPMGVPPLITEWRAGRLSIRDGNHRLAAMVEAGWESCWVIVWCNSPADFDTALQALGEKGLIP